jgi:hypothetical protein
MSIDPERVQWLEKEIINANWIAYDPERETYWNSIINAK